MDTSTLTILCGIVTCIIGICTFVVGMKGRASNDGMLIQKINQALSGIEELKQDFKFQANMERGLELKVQTHTEQIKGLYKTVEGLTETNRLLSAMADALLKQDRREDD